MHFTETETHLLQLIGATAQQQQTEAYAVGGFVRDKLLQRPCKDIDIVCLGDGIALAKAVAEQLRPKPYVAFFKNFGTAQIKTANLEIEFVGARKESYQSNSRNPTVTQGTLADDLARRDFTINALAIQLSTHQFGEIIDHYNGQEHLQKKLLTTPLNPTITFNDDPLRMLRCVRFATQLNFSIAPETYQAIQPLAHRLSIISTERINTELNKIIAAPQPSIGFKLLFNTQLLHQFFPEMVKLQGVSQVDNFGHKDNFYHTLQVLDNISLHTDKLWLRWGALLHDIAKPQTQKFEEGIGWTFHGHEFVGMKMVPKIFTRLKLPLDEKLKYVQKLVLLHLRPIALTKENISDSAIRRLIFDAGDDLEDLLLLCDADITSKNEEKVKRYKANLQLVKQRIAIVEERDKIRNWQPPINGELIMETFNLPPCKTVGILKEHIKDSILDGIIPNTYDDAYALMLQKANELGLIAV